MFSTWLNGNGMTRLLLTGLVFFAIAGCDQERIASMLVNTKVPSATGEFVGKITPIAVRDVDGHVYAAGELAMSKTPNDPWLTVERNKSVPLLVRGDGPWLRIIDPATLP